MYKRHPMMMVTVLIAILATDVCVLSATSYDEFHPLHQIYSWGFDNDVLNSSSSSDPVDLLNQDNDQLDNQQLFYNNNGADIISNYSSSSSPPHYAAHLNPNSVTHPPSTVPISMTELSKNITNINGLIASLANQLKVSQNQIAKLTQQMSALQTPRPSPAARVAFHGQRSSSALGAATDLSTPGKIPYDKALTNNGNGLNLSSGVFTAPFGGLYYFAWTGESSSETLVYLDSSALPNDHLCSTYTSSAYQSLKCHAIVNLKKGDQVWAALSNYKMSGIFDRNWRFTNFIGLLLG